MEVHQSIGKLSSSREVNSVLVLVKRWVKMKKVWLMEK